MTLAAGFKFEHRKAEGISPILLVSDSRYSYSSGTPPYRDDGKKVHALATNIYAVFAGNVLEAQRALAKVKECLSFSASGSFEDIRKLLKSSSDSTITTWDCQTPHFLLGVISTEGASKLLYARPDGTRRRYKVLERSQAVIGWQQLEPKLKKKIDAFKPKGLYHPKKHFMFLPDDIFPSRKQQVIHDAREISGNILRDFLEIVDDPIEHGVNPPLQNVLLLPSGSGQIELFTIDPSSIKNPKIAQKTARASEVSEESDPGYKAIVELNYR